MCLTAARSPSGPAPTPTCSSRPARARRSSSRPATPMRRRSCSSTDRARTRASGFAISLVAFSRDYRVYAVDMIGEPGFSAETRPPLASDAHAAWLDDVWRALGVARASVVGVSLGGWLAADYAIRRPHHVIDVSRRLLRRASAGRTTRCWRRPRCCWSLENGEEAARSGVLLGRVPLPPEVAEFVVAISPPLPSKNGAASAADGRGACRAAYAGAAGPRAPRRDDPRAETRERMERLTANLHLTWLEDAGHILGGQAARVLGFPCAPTASPPV